MIVLGWQCLIASLYYQSPESWTHLILTLILTNLDIFVSVKHYGCLRTSAVWDLPVSLRSMLNGVIARGVVKILRSGLILLLHKSSFLDILIMSARLYSICSMKRAMMRNILTSHSRMVMMIASRNLSLLRVTEYLGVFDNI